MLTKLTNLLAKIKKELKKSDIERYLEKSTDISDLERRIDNYNRRGNQWTDNRYY